MFGHYLTIAWRNFRRHKLHTAISVIGLAIGLTCFVGAYVVADYVESFDKSYPNSDRIYVISQQTRISGSEFDTPPLPVTAEPVAKYLRTDFPELGAVAYSISAQEFGVKSTDRKSFQQVQFAEPQFLDVFKMPFVSKSAENPLATPRSAVIRRAAAEQLFGNKNPLGQTVPLGNRLDVTITGVVDKLPSPSHLVQTITGKPFDLLVSMDAFRDLSVGGQTDNLAEDGASAETWISVFCFTYVLLPADGSLTIDAFRERLAGFGDRHMPPSQGRAKFTAEPVSQLTIAAVDNFILQGALGISATTMLLILGGLVLGTACLNYANLAIAQTISRTREVGMRKVMGAKRGQVLAQYLFEAFLLVAAALALALGLIAFGVSALDNGSLLNMRMPWSEGVGFWAFLASAVIAVTVVAGGYPAFVLARVRPIQALRAGAIKGGPRRLRMLLVGVQFTAASFLLIAVMVIAAHNYALRRTGLSTSGSQQVVISNNILTANIDPETLRTAMLRDPRIEAVTFSQYTPWGFANNIVTTSKSPDPAASRRGNQRYNISYDYFAALDMRVLAGRTFSRDRSGDISTGPAPTSERSGPVHTVIDSFTAEKMGWTNPADAVGQIVYEHMPAGFGRDKTSVVETEIIGVVEYKPLKLISMGLTTTFYYLNPQSAGLPIIKISGTDIPGALAYIDDVWDGLAPNLPLKRSFMDEKFDQAYGIFEGIGGILTLLTGFAFVVATLGLFGMASLIARRRTHEIGIRKTMGASTGQILKMLLWDFSKPVTIANLIAWPAAFVVMMGYLSLFTIRVSLTPLPFIASLAITLFIAWIAVTGQAFRAARLKPANVLRYE